MVTLETLKKDWDSLAARDALHAILTDQSKSGGKWSIDEFMKTGSSEIQTVLAHLARIGYVPDSTGPALDFGCGVGRLTQALAGHFASCVGVDISPQMIQKAESLNRHGHCRYVVTGNGLLPFVDANFSFIYSNLVLQHMPPLYSTGYLREFMRLLAPGGVLVFGVQDSFVVQNISSALVRLRQRLRARSRLQTFFRVGTADMQMHCLPERVVRRALASAAIADIQLTNTAARNFNGELVYLREAPVSGYVGKQYCVAKLPEA